MKPPVDSPASQNTHGQSYDPMRKSKTLTPRETVKQAAKDLYYIAAEYQSRCNRTPLGGKNAPHFLDQDLIQQRMRDAMNDGRAAVYNELRPVLTLAGILSVLGTSPQEMRSAANGTDNDDYTILMGTKAFPYYASIIQAGGIPARIHSEDVMDTPGSNASAADLQEWADLQRKASAPRIDDPAVLDKVDSESVKAIPTAALLPTMGMYLEKLQVAAAALAVEKREEHPARNEGTSAIGVMQNALNDLFGKYNTCRTGPRSVTFR